MHSLPNSCAVMDTMESEYVEIDFRILKEKVCHNVGLLSIKSVETCVSKEA